MSIFEILGEVGKQSFSVLIPDNVPLLELPF